MGVGTLTIKNCVRLLSINIHTEYTEDRDRDASGQLLPDAWSTFPQHLYRQSHRLKQCSSIVSFVNAGHSRVCSLRIATPRKPPKIQQGIWAGSPRSRPASYLSTLKSHHASQNVRAPFWWMGLAGLRRAVLFGRACDWCFRAT